jgi:hypothetical protein
MLTVSIRRGDEGEGLAPSKLGRDLCCITLYKIERPMKQHERGT